MSDPTLSSAGLDPTRKKLLFRAWHRGMREMDIAMGKFADARLAGMNPAELAEFAELIDAPDPDILAWLTGRQAVPPQYDNGTWKSLKAFHTHAEPIKF